MSEQEMLDRIRARYANARGATGALRYVVASHVRLSPAWPGCIADALVLDTWGNLGPKCIRHPLIGFEVKVSRSDWLRELRDPGKSAAFRDVCREWYLVVPDRSIVREAMPEGWGLMVARGRLLVTEHPAPLNPTPSPMPRGLIAGFARAAVTQAVQAATAELDERSR